MVYKMFYTPDDLDDRINNSKNSRQSYAKREDKFGATNICSEKSIEAFSSRVHLHVLLRRYDIKYLEV